MSIRYEWTPSPGTDGANVWDNATSLYICRDIPSDVAEEIIRKLNAHDELVAVLEMAIRHWPGMVCPDVPRLRAIRLHL